MAVKCADTPAADSRGQTHLRGGRPRDYQPLVDLEQRTFGRHALDPVTIYWLLFRRWPGVIVAQRDEEIVGYVICRVNLLPWPARQGGISSIAVHPGLMRQGLGRRLMEAAIAFLRECKVRQIDLEVAVDNEAAIALYRDLGFEFTETLVDYYGPGQNGMRMRLRQDPQKGR